MFIARSWNSSLPAVNPFDLNLEVRAIAHDRSAGQSIAVRYDPAEPQKAEVDSATANWFVPGCTVAMGLAFLFLGLVFVVIGILALAGQR